MPLGHTTPRDDDDDYDAWKRPARLEWSSQIRSSRSFRVVVLVHNRPGQEPLPLPLPLFSQSVPHPQALTSLMFD